MSQVIIVSNRLPVSVSKENGRLRFHSSIGGLATGLSSYVGKKNIWIGWPGIASDELSDKERQEVVDKLAEKNYRPVWLTKRQIEDFYNGYSNSVLWPAFHSLRRSKAEKPAWWKNYRAVNQKFAEAALNVAESASRVWVHDYQLLLVPEMVRHGRRDIASGFFLHIPFPPLKSFAAIPEHKKLLKGMLGADVIGFHTPDYVTGFLDAVQAGRLGEIDHGQVITDGHVVRVSDFPMGIDYEKYSSAGRNKAVREAYKKYAGRYKRQKVILAVDRLDPSKGLVERLQAYQLFLEKYPRAQGKVVFVMVAAPSRTDIPAYRNLAKRLKALTGEINKKFGTRRWQAIDYINSSLPFEEVAALFQLADVAFIAPLKDGMNLVAKEFVASAHKNGALILSETAGASGELKDALLVNPRQPEEVATALHKALTMRRRELRRRLKTMRRQLSGNTVQEWAKDFVGALHQPIPGTPTRTRSLRERQQTQLAWDYRKAGKRLLLLDYDGSLVPFAEDYQAANPPQSLIKTLSELSNDPSNDVVMISGRSPEDLDKWFGNLPISLVAEHGAAVKKTGNKRWQAIEKTDTKWKQLILPVLERYTALTPKSRIENKPHTLVWHYRASPPYYAQKYAVTIKRVLKSPLKKHRLQLMQGNKILEIKNPDISKGKAAQDWLKRDYNLIVSFGDDQTDEELFSVLPETAYSIKVGRGRTRARYRIADYRDVRKLLQRLARS
jgi:trehalose 6-phosphate synthase/phosphatase